MTNIKRLLICLLAMLLIVPAVQAEDEEYMLADIAGLYLEMVSYDNIIWDFPIDLFDMDADLIRMANKQVRLPSDFVPDELVTMKSRKTDSDGNNSNGGVNKSSSSEMKLQRECAEALVEMFETALDEGYTLYLESAYRSYQTQKTMYYNRLERNNGHDDGWVSKPGASDHQTGLGCDVVPRSWRDKAMNEKMAKEEECIWMAENCHRFGFILRYPEDKEDVTEINYEPWHLRYVGNPAATYIMENGLCLEEFHAELQQAIQKFLDEGGRRSLVDDFLFSEDEE